MIRVLTYGTFDTLHYGHIRLINALSEMADEVYVGVSTDEFNAQKNKKAFLSFEERLQLVTSLKGVTKAFAECSWDQKIRDIQKYNIQIFAMGDDWRGRFDYLQTYCQVIYLPRTPHISSTLVRAGYLHSSCRQ